MYSISKSRSKLLAAGVLPTVGACLCILGCKHHNSSPGSLSAAGQPASIDGSWVTAARSCWPAMQPAEQGGADLRQYLNNAAHVRSTFPSYAALSDAQNMATLTQPLAAIQPPDTSKLAHSETPVLTRGQAAAGTGRQDAVVAATTGLAPPDSLCSIQSGTPEGFN